MIRERHISSWMDVAATTLESIGERVISLGPVGLGVWMSDPKNKTLLFVATVGVVTMLVQNPGRKHTLVLGFTTLVAAIVFGGRGNV